MKLKLTACLCAVCILLSACAPVIRGPRDEIRQYGWGAEFENGNRAELTFSDSRADFRVENSAFTLELSGLCSLTDDSIVIINDDDGVCYTFGYVLHGDCVELSYRGDAVTLEKKVEK